MVEDSFSKIAEMFEKAIELSAEARDAFLDQACGRDVALRQEVESLLAAEGEAGDFLDRPVLEQTTWTRDPSQPPDGRRSIGPYRLRRQIGEGGMSTVYLAIRDDDEYRQEVAIKVFAFGRERSDLLKRFRTERQILASLEHPSIARLLDGGSTEDGLPYIVMELVEGEPIDAYCDRLRLGVGQRIELFRTLCGAVRFAHQNLVVHRDIKPSNVLVTATGVLKLLDFGIAKLVNPERFPETIQRTVTGQRLMTPQYASPEQVQGAPITTASDVYSMGVLLYRLLSGHLPYRVPAGRSAEIEKAVVDQEPERPSIAISRVEVAADDSAGAATTPETVSRDRHSRLDRLRRRLAGDLDNIVLKALRKEPQRRYGSIEQLDEDLRRWQQGLPVLARPSSLKYRTGKFLRRHPAAAAFLLLVIGFAVAMWIQASRIAHERDQARRERDKAKETAAFLEQIFEVSDPDQARGERITAREILERGAERIDRELSGQPEVQATLAATIGGVYRKLGLFDQAEPLLARSLELRRSLLGEEHPEVADSLLGLGKLRADRGEFAEAEALLRQSLELRRRTLGGAHPAVAESLAELGVLKRETGDYDAARQLLLEALELRRAIPQDDRARLAETLTDLGEVYLHLDDISTAERLMREALEIDRTLFGEIHPKVATDLNNLAVSQGVQGRYADAEPLLRRVLELRRQLFGELHPLVAESLNNLGRLRREQGDLAAAQELLEDALRIQRQLGDETSRIVVSLVNLGFLLEERGHLESAEGYFRECLDLGRELLGQDNTYVGLCLRGLGSVLAAGGDPRAAEPLLRQSLAIQRVTFAADHRRVADSESSLGACLTSLGRFEEAEPLVVASYESLTASLGPEHRRSLGALDRVIALYEAWGRPVDAAAYRQKK